MDRLERLGVADNTLLIVTSDNGPVLEDGYQDQAWELLNGHSPSGALRGNKYGVYEAGARVPAIVRWPGHIAAGTQSEALVSQVDLYASLARLLGAVLPRGAAPDSRDDDPGEANDLAEAEPEREEHLKALMREAHVPNPDFPVLPGE